MAGSKGGQVQCTNVSITMDGLVEADESFTIHATVSPSSIQTHQQPTSVEVIIRDDDGKYISDIIRDNNIILFSDSFI